VTWQKIPCRWCGMNFELVSDCLEHERCHTDPMPPQPQVKTGPNSHPVDGGPAEIAWAEFAEPQAKEGLR
jgi:hypothetical protein